MALMVGWVAPPNCACAANRPPSETACSRTCSTTGSRLGSSDPEALVTILGRAGAGETEGQEPAIDLIGDLTGLCGPGVKSLGRT